MMKKINKTSENIENENLEKLKKIFPNFIKEGQIDFDNLRTFFDENEVLAENEKYGLSWAGKSNAFKNLRVPATGTLSPDEKESKNWDKTENLFIEGDNLEVLKLLQKHYREKIKMIYIDPPYNTGKDFIYKDNFTENKADYYERTGQTENGIKMTTNTESSGRYHSDWLTMMYPRLFLARNLLKEDGVIFISIDDNEVANLRLIMDEIFGEENFITSFLWKKKGTTTNVEGATVSSLTEYILCYGKSENGLNLRVFLTEERIYPHIDKDGNYRLTIIEKKNIGNYERQTMIFPILGQKPRDGKRWQIGEKKAQELELKNRFILDEGIIKLKIYDFEDKNTTSANPNLLFDCGSTESASKILRDLLGNFYFDNPKPVELIRKLILLSQSKNKDDIILDFFAGSGTTAHAVMDLNAEDGGNRKWICVQLPEAVDEKSEAKKAGFETIAQISRERIRRAGEKIGKGDIGFKALKLQNSNYRQWKVLENEEDKQKLLDQTKLFVEKPLVDKYSKKSVVYEILLKEGFDLNSNVVLNETNSPFAYWQVEDNGKKMFITFADKITQEQAESLNLTENDIFVCFDSALDDSAKINLSRNFDLRVI